MSISEVVFEVNNALLDMLASEIIPEIEPEEVTAMMLSKHARVNEKTAKNMLDGKVKAGLMTMRKARYNGHVVAAYKQKSPAG